MKVHSASFLLHLSLLCTHFSIIYIINNCIISGKYSGYDSRSSHTRRAKRQKQGRRAVFFFLLQRLSSLLSSSRPAPQLSSFGHSSRARMRRQRKMYPLIDSASYCMLLPSLSLSTLDAFKKLVLWLVLSPSPSRCNEG